MNKLVKILFSSICLLVASCAIEVEYIYTTILTFENHSSHTIEIRVDAGDSREKEPWGCTIKPNEHYSHIIAGDGPYPVWFIMEDGCVVIFDGEIETDHCHTQIEHNLCDKNSYSVKVSGKHKTKREYTYTFTDEDYDRAVAASRESEE